MCKCAPTEICNNLIDDDGDGDIDCADSDCPACPPEICDNGLDDDMDGDLDCEDDDCPPCLICYAIPQSNNGRLYEWDQMGNYNNVGTLGVNEVEAMSLSGDCNTIYAIDANVFGQVSTTNGSFTPIWNLGTMSSGGTTHTIQDVDGLAIDHNTGYFWASERRGGQIDLLFAINPNTGKVVEDLFGPGIDYVPMTGAYNDIDDLAYNPCTSELWGVSTNVSGGTNRIVLINTTTGSTTLKAIIPTRDMEGLTFNQSCQLIGSTGTSDNIADNTLFNIDVVNGTVSQIATLPHSDVEAVACCLFGPDPVCVNFIDPGEIGEDQFFCDSGNPSLIESIQDPSGGMGATEYIWLQTTTSCGTPPTSASDPNWSVIAGATSATYDPPFTNQNICYIRLVKRDNCNDYLVSNIVTISISADAGCTITCPPDETVECLSDISAGLSTVSSCSDDFTISNEAPELVSGTENCPGAEYRIVYMVTDECGRTNSCVQTFTISNTSPTITCADDEIVTCLDDINETPPTVTTSCGITSSVTTTGPTLITGTEDCDGATYEIVYTVEDACGRTASCTQTFTLQNDGPVITCPADMTVTCFDDIAAGTPTFTTSCGIEATFEATTPTLTDNCDGTTYEITYTVTDECGRTDQCTQTFTLQNDGPIITCPADMTVTCFEDIAAGTPTFTTSCGIEATFEASTPTLTDNCDGTTYEITYTVTDDCGRTDQCTQTFTLENDGPVITCPEDMTVTCFDDIAAGTPTFTTSCGIEATFEATTPTLTDNCDGTTYEITYTVTDDCGRTDQCTQTFILENDGPVITCPADMTVTCFEDIAAGTPTFTTSCGIDATFEATTPTLTDNCDGTTYEITYTVTDDCGRTDQCTQTFILENDGPVITCPEDMTVTCFEDIAAGTPSFTTSCGIGATFEATTPTLTDNCDGTTYEITYTVTDDCGRTDQCTQTFILENDGPVITCPEDMTVTCFEDIAAGTPSFTTSCGIGATFEATTPTLTDNCDGTTYEITYTVTDDCGRTDQCTQTFTLQNDGPLITCPADMTVSCFEDIAAGTPTLYHQLWY